jgi:RNA polymerase sigma-70 factor (ECF subfamily)
MTFEEVYRRFRRPVWSLARQFLRSEDEALDATQEIFVRVWKGLSGFRGEAKLSTWVFQIAWNYLRSLRRKKGLQMYRSEEDVDALVARIPDTRANPERHTEAVATLSRVRAALRRLPEQQRIVVWLRDGEDLSYQEIAEVLDVPIGTIRSRLARARMALRNAADE